MYFFLAFLFVIFFSFSTSSPPNCLFLLGILLSFLDHPPFLLPYLLSCPSSCLILPDRWVSNHHTMFSDCRPLTLTLFFLVYKSFIKEKSYVVRIEGACQQVKQPWFLAYIHKHPNLRLWDWMFLENDWFSNKKN